MLSKLKIIKQNLTSANNLGLESKAQFFSFFNGSDDLCKLHAEAKQIDALVQIIGAGTNTIFPRAFNKLVIKSSDKSISEKKAKNNILVTAGAAVIWDDLIDFCVKKKYCGLANLAGIPGTVGAAPVQNIGAYGVELSDLLEEVLCFDLKTQKEVILSSALKKINNSLGIIFQSMISIYGAKISIIKKRKKWTGIRLKVFKNKNEKSTSELSGGQKSILALAFIFSLLIFKTAPFYIFDEVDAALDFCYTENMSQLIVKNFSFAQFIIVSLKKQIILNSQVIFEVKQSSGKSFVTRLERFSKK